MRNLSLHKIKKAMTALAGVLLVILLILSAAARNAVHMSRAAGNFSVIEDVSFEKIRAEDSPVGIVNECRFTLGEVGHADTLAFFINHHHVEVYLADECVYSLTADHGPIRTPGGFWPMVPLYGEDAGKEVRVVLAPLYSDYQDKIPDFLLGSEFAIYKAYFYQALPEMVLSLCVVLTGLFLLCMAVYNSIRQDTVFRLYMLSLLAISAGLWRVTYGRFAYLLFANHTVLVYYISIISLMLVALAMLNCVELSEWQKGHKAIRGCSLIYCVVFVGQFLLQLAGVLDLRQMLKATHAAIIVSAAALCFSGVSAWIGRLRSSDRTAGGNYSLLLGISTITDLLLHYFAETSVGMLFTLGAILCYSMLEGIRMLIRYTEQKNALEEMHTRLTLSRTTTMMSQIRSHFVFNILNAISGMCKYDPEKADDTVVRFARYLRNNIDIMEDDKNIPFAADLRQLEDYVMLEQVRFGDKLEFYTDVETDQFMIPPLILQPVVENAIKHGISKKQSNGTIILRTRDAGENIVITVEDDGVGFDTQELSKEKSVGLKNIRFRLHHLVNGTLDIASEEGKGTIVTITIPKKEDESCT